MSPLYSGLPGQTIIMSTPQQRIKHLFIQVTPVSDGKAVFVNITTAENIADATVILEPSDHPFVRKSSAVNFRLSKILDKQKILEAIDKGCVVPHEPMVDLVLERIQAGLLRSDETPRDIVRAFNAFFASAKENEKLPSRG